MTPQQRQEEFSKAYVQAIAAACGYTVGAWSQDVTCVDMTIKSPNKGAIDFQLKASAQPGILRTKHLAWQVSREHYDRMRRVNVAQPHYLALLWLPQAEDQWWAHSVEQLVRKCAYYVKMTGLPEATADDPTVQIPLAQVLTPTALQQMMTAAEQGEHLGWAQAGGMTDAT